MAIVVRTRVLPSLTLLQERRSGTKCPPRKRSRPCDLHLHGVVTPAVPTRARTTRVHALQSRTPAGAPDRILRLRALGGVLLRRALAPFAAQLRRVAVVPPGQAAMHWQRRQAAVQALIWRALAWRLGRSLRRTRRFLLRQAVTMQNPHLPTAGVPRRSVEASKWGPMPLRLRIRQRQRGLGVAAPPVQLARQCRGPRLLSTTRPRRLLGCHMPRLRLLQSGGRLRSPRRRLAVRGLAHRPSLCHQRRHPRLGWRP